MMPTSDCKSKAPAGLRFHQRGFTLLEIILVLTIIGMASVLVVPNITSLESRSFSAQIRQANSLLNYARRSAVVLGHPTKATFVPFATGTAENDNTNDRNDSVSWKSSGSSLRYRDSTDTEFLVDDNVDIFFFPEGGSTGGTLIFSQDGRNVVIQIDPFTGRIDTLSEDHEIYDEL